MSSVVEVGRKKKEMLGVRDKTAHKKGNSVVSFILVPFFFVYLKARVEAKTVILPVANSYPDLKTSHFLILIFFLY